MAVLYGTVFEKMGVNVSEVFGTITPQMQKEGITGDEFWASGLSLVAHPSNPFVPPIHFNTRCFITNQQWWFGGGIDLNPIYPNSDETLAFHADIKALCNAFDDHYYQRFSQWCDEYFWLPHRGQTRGVGGIFFDKLNTDFISNFEFIKALGNLFSPLYTAIVKNKQSIAYTNEHRQHQLLQRGRYAEFNLLYDRGIKFGLASGGNADGMFMSLPPLVRWN